jgi:hypothetical protein
VNNWGSVVRFTASEKDLGHVNDRIPAVFIIPGTTNLLIVISNADSANQVCPESSVSLLLNTWHRIRIEVIGNLARVYLDEVLLNSCPVGDRQPYSSAKVYASDLWYSPAVGEISNLSYTKMSGT